MIKHLSETIQKYLSNRAGLGKIAANSSWLVSERVIMMAIGLVVSIVVARYLGPEKYGVLNYALSVVAFLGTFVYFGLSGLVVRDIVNFPEEKETILGTTFILKSAGSILAFILVITICFITHEYADTEFLVLLIIGLSLFARPFEVIDLWFQSQVTSKYAVTARLSAGIAGACLKLLLVFFGFSLVAFAAVSSFEIILAAVLLVFIYRFKGFSILEWKLRFAKAKELIGQSWIIILSGFLALVNLRVDQIMIRWISGASEVGIYSVAVNLSEVWYFIPTAIASSLYPRLIELKKEHPLLYEKRLQQVLDTLFATAFTVAVLMTVVSNPLISIIYGDDYSRASSILVIHVWAGIFMFMRAIFSKWIFVENALKFSLLSHGAGALINVILNFIMIPKWGGQGAAIATLVSYAISSYLILFIYPKTRSLAVKMSMSLLLFFRLIIRGRRLWK